MITNSQTNLIWPDTNLPKKKDKFEIEWYQKMTIIFIYLLRPYPTKELTSRGTASRLLLKVHKYENFF